MATTRTLELADRRRLVFHDSGPAEGADALTVVWHHGSPQTGHLLEPVVSAASARGMRVVSYARPAYGGSTRNYGRDVASAARDVAEVADALALDRFAVMGTSGGGPHALACAALLPDRVLGAVCLASPAPYTDSFDWFGGMVAPGGLRAALAGLQERERFAETDQFDESSFTDRDWAALRGAWAAMGQDAARAEAAGPAGLIDDDMAAVTPWGFALEDMVAPVLLVQGGEDRVIPSSHAHALLQAIPSAQLWLRPRDGHISVLHACPVALDWLRDVAADQPVGGS